MFKFIFCSLIVKLLLKYSLFFPKLELEPIICVLNPYLYIAVSKLHIHNFNTP